MCKVCSIPATSTVYINIKKDLSPTLNGIMMPKTIQCFSVESLLRFKRLNLNNDKNKHCTYPLFKPLRHAVELVSF